MAQEAKKFVFPSSIEDQKKLTALIMEAVKAKQEIDVQNGEIKIIKEDLKDLFEMDSTTAGKYINRFYDEIKFQDQIAQLEEVNANADILRKHKT
jgi:hypothetical protein